MQANGRQADRGIPFDAECSPEVKVAPARTLPSTTSPRLIVNRTQRHSAEATRA